jgi:hypothetical protein
VPPHGTHSIKIKLKNITKYQQKQKSTLENKRTKKIEQKFTNFGNESWKTDPEHPGSSQWRIVSKECLTDPS